MSRSSRRSFLLISQALVFGFAVAANVEAHAEPKLDVTPDSVGYVVGIDDDVSMSRSQHVSIAIRNVGNVPFEKSGPMKVKLGTLLKDGYIYGPPSRGGQLGGRINPGETGYVSLRVPLGTLRHCQPLRVQIDTTQRFQAGPGVFGNDAKDVVVQDFKSIRNCAVVVQPLPMDPRNAPGTFEELEEARAAADATGAQEE